MNKRINLQKILILIIAFLIFASIPMTVYLVKRQQELRKKAEEAKTSLSFSSDASDAPDAPDVISVDQGQTFELDIMIATGENSISGAELYLFFDASYLEGISLQNGTFLPNVLQDSSINAGLATIVLGADPGDPKSGEGTLASLTLKALAPVTDTKVSIGSDSVLPGEEIETLLASRGEASVTILAVGPTSTPTSTPTATASPTPTVTPGAEAGSSSTETATATPTSTRAPTATPTSGSSGGTGGGTMPTNTPTPKPVSPAQPTPTPKIPTPGFTTPTIFLVLLGILSLGFGVLAILQ